MQAIVLASGSQYRYSLLARSGLKFQTISPNIDESAFERETPEALCRRLGCAKALEVQRLLEKQNDGGHLIIASDQVAECNDTLLGKPGHPVAAREQLLAMSGHTVNFHTSVYILDTVSNRHYETVDHTRVQMRQLSAAAIERYVEKDQPMDCAGSFKVESLGISLFETVQSVDPTALVGLPMISVCDGLRHFGVELP